MSFSLFRRFLVLAALAGFVLAVPAATSAQERKRERTAYSEAEKIGFAFYRLADKSPPFNKWIVARDEYLLAKPSAKREYLQRETERLAKAYNEYMVDEDMVFLRTEVTVKVPNAAERKSYDGMGVRKPVQIILNEVKESYFPVQIGDMWIAVVPNDLENHLFLSLAEAEFEDLIRKMNLDAARGSARGGLLEIRLRPISIDTKAPLHLDGIDAWLMLGEIASISLWRTKERDTLVWEKNMDWYVPQQQKDLLDLYSR